jgi:AI-2E family transporter
MPDTAAPAAGSHPVEVHASGTPLTGLGTLAVGVIAIAALYFGREVFVPMALALLLSFALGPPVLLPRRWHINRVFAVIAAVVLAFSVILGIGVLIGNQLAHLAENLPGYQTNITEKIHSLRDTTTSSGVVRRAATMLSGLGNEITTPREKVGRPAANGPVALAPGVQQQKPVPVEIRPPDPTPVQLILEVAGPLLRPLATAGIVLVFVIFFLLQRQDLRDRFIRLTGARDLRRTTLALDDAGHSPPQLPPDPDHHKHQRWCVGRHRAVVHRRAEPGTLGRPHDALAFRPLHRPGRCRHISGSPRRCRRSGVGDAVLGRRSVSCRRAHYRLCDRTLALRHSMGLRASRCWSPSLSGHCSGGRSGCYCRRR